MQEEVNEKTVSLCITGGKVTVRLLKQAMMRFLAAMEKEKAEKARKQQVKGPPDKDYHGKQSLKKLAQQNVQLSNIEITDNNIKAFEKVAKKYGIDFSLKRDKSVDPPRYFVSGILWFLRSAVHGQTFRLCQQNIVLKDLINKRGYILFISPSGRTIFFSLAKLLSIFSLKIYHCPHTDCSNSSRSQDKQREREKSKEKQKEPTL